ncbi:MAG: hypothetical protein ACREX3_17435, partial [Gammaproteobacteria bacterium]
GYIVHSPHTGGLDHAAALLDGNAFTNGTLHASRWSAAVEVGVAAAESFGGVAEVGGEVGHEDVLLSARLACDGRRDRFDDPGVLPGL